MAQVAGLSPFHFSRVFKESVGVTPNRYVNQCRIEKAKELLRQPEMRVDCVAKACGFKNPSYFIRQFRQSTGVTPKVYRDG